MKKTSIIVVAVIIVILGFLVFRKDKMPEVTDTVPENEAVQETPGRDNETTTVTYTPTPQNNYSYTSDKFDFAVKLPGLVVTPKSFAPASFDAIFTFGVGDQSNIEEEKRVPNTMAVYIWNDRAEFDLMVASGTSLGKETVNGRVYDVYSFTNEDTTSYHYTITIGNLIYDVGVRNKADAAKFFLL